MGWHRLTACLSIAALAGAGCRNRGQVDLLEAELRTRGREIRQLREENARLAVTAQALQAGPPAAHVPGPVYGPPVPDIAVAPGLTISPPEAAGPVMPAVPVAPEPVVPTAPEAGPAVLPVPRPLEPAGHAGPPAAAVALAPLTRIEVAGGTGGVDDDGVGGDEVLLVVVAPKDEDDSAVKVVASLRVEVVQIDARGLKSPLSAWDVPPTKLRSLWRGGAFSTGFFVRLPWKVPPTAENLRVVARLTLPGGQTFEDDKDVKVRPPR